MGVDTIFKVGELGDKCVQVRENFSLLYPEPCIQYALKISNFSAIISQFWCIFGYTTIMILCSGLSPTVFAMPI